MVPFIEKRIREAERLGFKQAIMPKRNLEEVKKWKGTLKLSGVKDIGEAVSFMKGRK